MAAPVNPQHPVVGQFDSDPRVFVDQQTGRHHYEDDHDQEWEWTGQTWIPLVDEDQWKAQQSAYAVAGVDESTPANAAAAREERRAQRVRKKAGEVPPNATSSSSNSATRPAKQAPHTNAPKNTAVFVSNLPPTTNAEQLANVFSKAGVLLIGNDGEPRIKLYTDDEGRFKGEALVMYFKEGSVDLAVRLLDDTELEMGGGMGNMRVREADYERYTAGQGEAKEKGNGAAPKKNGEAAAGEGSQPAAGGEENKGKRKDYSAEEKHKMTKRIRAMQNKVTWHSDDDLDDPAAPIGGAPRPASSRQNRVVVLKGMFKLSDLEKDPALLLELKEDVREEAETLGEVTSVVIYDKEEDGVMTVKFKDAQAAQSCVMKMNGRYFDGRRCKQLLMQQIAAATYTGKERFRKTSNRGLADEDDDREERDRLEGFAAWLVDGSDNDD